MRKNVSFPFLRGEKGAVGFNFDELDASCCTKTEGRVQNCSRKAPHVRHRNRRLQRDGKKSPLALVQCSYRLGITRSAVLKSRGLSTKSPRVFSQTSRVSRKSCGLFQHDGRAKYPTGASGLKISREVPCRRQLRFFVSHT